MVLELKDLFDDEFVEGRRHSGPLAASFIEGTANYLRTPSFHCVENVKGVVTSAISRVERNPRALRTAAVAAKARGEKDPDILLKLAERLHLVVRQLRERRKSRSTLDVNDEYDVQDLGHALLMIYFDDIRKEEWAPSYAGGASRMDFFLPEIESVVEIKMTRESMTAKQLGEQLIVDIAKYEAHPGCRCLIALSMILIANPRGIENDLSKDTENMIVRVMIVPK